MIQQWTGAAHPHNGQTEQAMIQGTEEVDYYPSENHPNGTNKLPINQKQASIQLPTASTKL